MIAQSNPVPRTAYSLDEAAQSLGLSRRTLYDLMDRGQLTTVKLGKRRLVPAAELERLVAPLNASSVEISQ